MPGIQWCLLEKDNRGLGKNSKVCTWNKRKRLIKKNFMQDESEIQNEIQCETLYEVFTERESLPRNGAFILQGKIPLDGLEINCMNFYHYSKNLQSQ